MFGQKHKVAEAVLKKAVDGPNILVGDSRSWSNLLSDMKSCLLTLSQMNYLGHLNATQTLEQVPLRLPVAVQTRWVEHSTDIYLRGQEPTFADLTEFIERRAEVLNNRYAHLLGANDRREQSSMGYPPQARSKPANVSGD